VRFFLDQDVYAMTARFLKDSGHDVLTASDLGMSTASDSTLLDAAHQDSRILVTRDRDFGGLVFLIGSRSGVLYLRISPSTMRAVHEELAMVLASHTEEELQHAFVVIEPGRHRFRKLSN
jgi:predicted nuclease of predicted toxin-antitoxin system